MSDSDPAPASGEVKPVVDHSTPTQLTAHIRSRTIEPLRLKSSLPTPKYSYDSDAAERDQVSTLYLSPTQTSPRGGEWSPFSSARSPSLASPPAAPLFKDKFSYLNKSLTKTTAGGILDSRLFEEESLTFDEHLTSQNITPTTPIFSRQRRMRTQRRGRATSSSPRPRRERKSTDSEDEEFEEVQRKIKGQADSDILHYLSEIKKDNPDYVQGLVDSGLVLSEPESEIDESKITLAEESVVRLRDQAESEKEYQRQNKAKWMKLKREERSKKLQVILETKSITSEERQRIDSTMIGASSDSVVSGFGITLLREHFHRLRPGQWLDDEVINFYMELIIQRSRQDSNLPKIYAYNSHFYSFLAGKTFDAARAVRWSTRAQINLFELDKLLVPVHLGNHWCLAVINFRAKCFEYYDALGGKNPLCLERLRKYVQIESVAKLKRDFDFSGWTDFQPDDIPHQHNGFDCGVFLCKYADFNSQNKEYEFDQRFMPYFRSKIILELLNSALYTDK